MRTLSSKTRGRVLIPRLETALRFQDRARGLLGRSSLSPEQGLWIDPCSSIHTFFMKFPIDCVFVDQELKVKAIYSEIKPWRIVWAGFGARSVIELAPGSVERLGLQVGEELHVGA